MLTLASLSSWIDWITLPWDPITRKIMFIVGTHYENFNNIWIHWAYLHLFHTYANFKVSALTCTLPLQSLLILTVKICCMVTEKCVSNLTFQHTAKIYKLFEFFLWLTSCSPSKICKAQSSFSDIKCFLTSPNIFFRHFDCFFLSVQ